MVKRAVTGHRFSLLRLVNLIEVRVLFVGVEPGKKQEYVVWMLPALEMMQPTVDRVRLVVSVRWVVSCCPVVHGANH